MIIIRMSGGLGNQMFQYALYLKLRALGREVCFDDFTQYDETAFAHSSQKRRPKHLGRLGIQYPVASIEELAEMTDSSMDMGSRIRRKIHGRKSLEKDDQDFIFDPSFLETESGYFCGTFQSQRYFQGVEDDVRSAFDLAKWKELPVEERGKGTAAEREEENAEGLQGKTTEGQEEESASPKEQIRKDTSASPEKQILKDTLRMEDRIRYAGRHSTSVHLRFGDYVAKSDIYGGICTDAYYDAAVRMLMRDDPDMVFFVFSNDAARAEDWVRKRVGSLESGQQEQPQGKARQQSKEQTKEQKKERLQEHLKGESNGSPHFMVVTGRDEDHGYLDLYLMSLCRNHVIANSSFSWWGAFLRKDRSGKVIAPSFWIQEADGSQLRRQDIYTDEMILVNPRGELADPGESRFIAPEAPWVSVIVAAYNIASYLPRALDSLREQTLNEIEIIVVDDGSTDGTGAIADAYAGQDNRIRVIHKPNGGLSDARNAGLSAASGRYIGFLDGDDWCEPDMFEAMLRGCLLADADVATVNYVTEQVHSAEHEEKMCSDGQDGSRTKEKPWRRAIILTREQAIDRWIASESEGNEKPDALYNSAWSKLYRRDVIEGMTFAKGKKSEDIMWTTKAFVHCHKVCLIPVRLYHYLEDRSGSIMNVDLGSRRMDDEIPFWREHTRYLEEHGLQDLAGKAEFSFYKRMMYYDMEFRAAPELAQYAQRLEEMLRKEKTHALEVVKSADNIPRKDRWRVSLFLREPSLYSLVSKWYEKTVVAWKNRKESR